MENDGKILAYCDKYQLTPFILYSTVTQLDDDVLSDNIIENINNQNLSWVVGRNFPENEAKEFLAKGMVNYINLDEINTLDTPNYRTTH
jgi:hypothetical protein